MTDSEPAGYLAFALSGVQEFIVAARRTADLWAASTLMSHLSRVAQGAIGPSNVILPSLGSAGASSPNRVFARVPPGTAAALGRSAEDAVKSEWRSIARREYKDPDKNPDLHVTAALETFPDIKWVAYEPTTDDGQVSYESAWQTVSSGMDARKRVRDFPGYVGTGKQVCSLCGRRDAFPIPAGLRMRRGEALCPVCAVKRDVEEVGKQAHVEATGFPSTASIATAPFKARVLDALSSAGPDSPISDAVIGHRSAITALGAALREIGIPDSVDIHVPGALPGLERRCDQLGSLAGEARAWVRQDGDWCYAETWDHETILRERTPPNGRSQPDPAPLRRACEDGRQALSYLLSRLKATDGVSPPASPASYLALLMQDADDMGHHLGTGGAAASGTPLDARRHQAISQVLGRTASDSTAVLEDHLGRAAYAGGDDLFGFVPLTGALAAAGACRDRFREQVGAIIPGATASSALVCFHKSYPLQEACRRGRAALKAAKDQTGKDHLVIVALRRGGERARLTASWTRQGMSVTEAVATLSNAFATGLSPSFAYDMYRERTGLASLAASGRRGQHHDEIRRLLSRHGNSGAFDAVRALEPARNILTTDDIEAWVGALDVSLFFNREAR